MKLVTLYKRNVTGSVQEWTIEVEDNKFRSISGQKGGKLIINNWTICFGKNIGKANETTDAEQASAEARAKWQKKKDKGYTEDVNNVDDAAIFKPMLAKKYEDYKKKLTYPLYCQPKLDGIRCIATKAGLKTRNGKNITAVPHIEKDLELFFNMYPNLVLDGELYNHKFKEDFNKICSLVKREKCSEEQLKESKKLVEYHVYDNPSSDACFGERSEELATIFENYSSSYNLAFSPIILVETKFIDNEETLNEIYGEFLEAGYEGQMVRADKVYENKRSAFLLKRKEFTDDEFTILGAVEGKGKREGTVGKFNFETKTGVKFNSNIKGNFVYLAKLWKDREQLIGKEATIKYFTLTPDGVPRFPYVIAIRDYE